MRLPLKLGNNYQITKNMLGQISWAYSHNHTSISLDIGKMSQKDGQTMNNLCRQFYSHTLFSKYFYQKQEKIVRLNLQRATATSTFFVVVGLNGLRWAKCLKKQNTKAKIMLFLVPEM